jgi:eukaryotic-like serine/threonine-protein kinase
MDEESSHRGPAGISRPAESSPPVSLYGADLSAGALVGPYVVQELIYRGGAANLYRAEEPKTRRIAAVKVLHPQFAHLSKMLRRFQQEADSLRQLRHPNIVEIWESGELRDGRPYIAMEWLDGRSLAAELHQRGPYSAREAVAALEQIGRALIAAHRIGIVHRDIKAQNVMVSRRGDEVVFKLVDFGIAKLLAPDSPGGGLTSTGMRMGTPVSMAPEQIRGEPADQRTDIYALGVLMYQLATGRFPFQGANSIEIEEMHLHAPVPRPSELASVPERYDVAATRCLEKRPEVRFQSVDELLAFLRESFTDPHPHSFGRALGLFVQASADAEEGSTAILETLDSSLAEAQRTCREMGLTICLEAGNAFLAAIPSPGQALEERALRERLLRSSLALFSSLRSRFPSIHFSLSMQLAPAQMQRTVKGELEIKGGELLALTRWIEDSEGVSAAAAVTRDLGSSFSLAPSERRSDLFHVQPPLNQRVD